MPIRIPPQHTTDRTDANVRQDLTQSVDLDAVDYSNQGEVSTALAAIGRIGGLDSFISWAFPELNKGDAIAAICHTALCEKAAVWKQNNPDRQAVAGLGEGDKHQARAKFVSLLTPQGLAAVMEQYSAGRYEVLPHGVRFVPNTGSHAVDALLTEVLPHAEATVRLREWGDVPQVEGAQMLQLAHVSRAVGETMNETKTPEGSDAMKMQAAPMVMGQSGQSGQSGQLMEARLGEARFWEGAAAYWEGVNGPAQEAVVWGRAAKAWQAVGNFERAAEAHEQQAAAREREAWKVDGSSAESAKVWRMAAEAWESAGAAWKADGQPCHAAVSLEMEAQAWHASGEFARAAGAWAQAAVTLEEAGDEVRAAAARQHEAAARTALEYVRAGGGPQE